MNMAWVAILALVAGAPGGLTAPDHHDRGCLAVVATVKAPQTGADRPRAVARRVEGRPTVPPWSSPLFEECDSQEVDETWMVHLDAMTSIPIAWICWARPCSSIDVTSVDPLHPSSILSIPLRC